jgi:hypothetical protein
MRDLIGKKAYLILEEQVKNDFSYWNISTLKIGCYITGVDEGLGIWIRGDSFNFAFSVDKQGNHIPRERRKEEKAEVDIFFPWRYIKGIIDIKDDRAKIIKDKREIGFRPID